MIFRYLGIWTVLASVGGACASPSWRGRAELSAPLNADAGWLAGENEAVTVVADRPFRLRFEWERTEAYRSGMPGVILQYRRNGDEDWVEIGAYDFPYPEGEEPRSPRVSAVRTSGYMHGEPTTDLLGGSSLPFVGGSGVNLAAAAPSWSEQAGHMELEWPLVIRRWADGAESNEAGDRFAFRLAESTGRALAGGPVASARLEIAPGHLGGTFVETPGRIGPWQASNGDLYFVMEPAESSNVFMMVKSEDGGMSWREVDGEHRPRVDDLESVDGRLVGDRIEMVHQVTPAVYRHAFRTSDHPTHPDTWAVTDELVAEVESMAQAASLVVREDGSLVAFYVGETLRYSERSPAGEWGPSRVVDPGGAPFLAGPQAVLGAKGEAHLAYYAGDGTIWYRRMDASGALGPARLLAEGVGTGEDAYGSTLPLVYLSASETVVVAYQLADLRLWERRIGADGTIRPAVAITDRRVARETADSQQPAADLFAAGDRLVALFIDDATRAIYSVEEAEAGAWGKPTLRFSDARADWARGMAHAASAGGHVVRFVYDAGSGGGAGMNRYGAFPVSGE